MTTTIRIIDDTTSPKKRAFCPENTTAHTFSLKLDRTADDECTSRTEAESLQDAKNLKDKVSSLNKAVPGAIVISTEIAPYLHADYSGIKQYSFEIIIGDHTPNKQRIVLPITPENAKILGQSLDNALIHTTPASGVDNALLAAFKKQKITPTPAH